MLKKTEARSLLLALGRAQEKYQERCRAASLVAQLCKKNRERYAARMTDASSREKKAKEALDGLTARCRERGLI